jgi:hypothetical protein
VDSPPGADTKGGSRRAQGRRWRLGLDEKLELVSSLELAR